MASTASFPLFPTLPFEIRQQIWEAAMPQIQRVITIGKYYGHYRFRPGCRGLWAAYQPLIVPDACHEAREAGLKRYHPCFIKQLGSPILFDLSTDLLLFTSLGAFDFFVADSLNTWGPHDFGMSIDLRFLAICGPLNQNSVSQSLYLFDRLEEVMVQDHRSLPPNNTHSMDADWVDLLRRTWIRRRELQARKWLLPQEDRKLPKVSFLSLEDLRGILGPAVTLFSP